MKQADLGLNLTTKRTRKREFLAEMERVVPWAALVALITPYAPEGRRGRPPFPVETMLRIHFMQQWFTLSDPAMEEALHDVPLFREFAGLNWDAPLPDETTILRFRRLLEEHKLAPRILALVNELLGAKGLLLRAGTVVDATLIAAPSSTKNASGERDPQMKQSKKGNQWYFGMKAHIGVDADSGLVHTVRGTAGNVNDVIEANTLLHGEETQAWGDAGYQGAGKRPDAKDGVRWNIAMRPGKRKLLDKTKLVEDLTDQIERIKASIRAKVEHPFRVIKRQFGHVKVRYRGLAKNTAQLLADVHLDATVQRAVGVRGVVGHRVVLAIAGDRHALRRHPHVGQRQVDRLGTTP
jgi:IS5 family transposase